MQQYAIAAYAMLAACLLPLLFAVIARLAGGFRGQDNHEPRQFLGQLQGMAARAHAAQQNSYETLPLFVGAVLWAQYMLLPPPLINQLTLSYVGLRLAYGLAYLADQDVLRSVLWWLALCCPVLLLMLSVRG